MASLLKVRVPNSYYPDLHAFTSLRTLCSTGALERKRKGERDGGAKEGLTKSSQNERPRPSARLNVGFQKTNLVDFWPQIFRTSFPPNTHNPAWARIIIAQQAWARFWEKKKEPHIRERKANVGPRGPGSLVEGWEGSVPMGEV